MPTRHDPHAPANLVTEDYEYAYAYDAHPEEGDQRFTWPLLNQLLEQGWRFDGVHGGGQCDHCGARIRYVAVLKHIPSHKLIQVGSTCLENRFERATSDFHRLRKQAKLNRAEATKKEQLAAWLAADEANAQTYAYLILQVEEKGNYGFNDFFFDLLKKLQRNSELTERQVAAVLKGKARDEEFMLRREAERAMLNPVVEGKQTITGVILKIDLKENAFGTREVMTVLDDRGFKVWGTQPAAIYDAKKGDSVVFNATVKASDNDNTFGFFSRPSKASFTPAPETEEVEA